MPTAETQPEPNTPISSVDNHLPDTTLLARLKLLDAPLIRILTLATFGYIAVFALLTSFISKDVASWIATPLLTMCIFIIDKWDRTRERGRFHWRELLKPPNLNYWNILWIFVSIHLAQFIFALLWGTFDEKLRPSFYETLPEGIDGFIAAMDDTTTLISMWIALVITYSFGGYVAAKLPNYKCPSPYRHALYGSLAAFSISAVFMYPLVITKILGGLTEENAGFPIFVMIFGVACALCGVWIAKKPMSRRPSARRPKGQSAAGVSMVADTSTTSILSLPSEISSIKPDPKRVRRRRRGTHKR